jgi:hypothetical protein
MLISAVSPPGNCTINEYPSLAVCASVVDVSSHLTNDSSSGVMRTFVSNHQFINTSAGIMNVTSASTGSPPSVDGFEPRLGYQLQFNDSLSYTNTSTPLADAFIIIADSTHTIYPNSTTTNESVTYLQHYKAYEFMLEWCAQNYTNTVLNGISSTQKLGAIRNFTAPDSLDSSVTLSSASLDPTFLTDVTFTVDQMTHYSLQKYLEGLLSGWISGGDDQCWTATSDAILCLYEPFELTPNTSPDRGDTLYDVFNQLSGNGTGSGVAGLEAILNNIATSMSN